MSLSGSFDTFKTKLNAVILIISDYWPLPSFMALNLHSEAYLNEHQKVLVILKYYKVYLPWLIIKLHKFLNNLIQNNMPITVIQVA